MKRYTYSLVGLLALLLMAPPVQAVTPAGLLSNTTLDGSITSTQTTLVLTSASASSGSTFGAPAAGQCLYIDLEMMRIQSMSSTTATVQRGTRHRSAHLTAAIILTGPCGEFKAVDPPALVGNQDCSLYVLPWVNQTTGDTWWCDLQPIGNGSGVATGGSWSVTNVIARQGTAGSRRVAQ